MDKENKYGKPEDCPHKDKETCKGCAYSYYPALYDGGCKILYPPKEEKAIDI
jgi:hypothetical protein